MSGARQAGADDARTAVVLSGGGANGAYEVGVLRALTEGASPATRYRPIDPGIFTGTSVGAFNATFLVSAPSEPVAATVRRLQAIWLERIAASDGRCGNGVFRVRGLPLQLFNPGCLLHPLEALEGLAEDAGFLSSYWLSKGVEALTSRAPLEARLLSLIDLDAYVSERPLDRLIPETIDLDGLRRSPKELTIVASNWQRGTVRLFSKYEVTETIGVDAIKASTALPGIFPPVTIAGEPFVDGGVLLNTPLGPAIAAGAREVHVLFVDPRLQDIPLGPQPATVDTFYRLFAILWAARVRADVAIAKGITRSIELLEQDQPEALGRDDLATFLTFARRLFERAKGGLDYRKVAVHAYRPSTDLGGGAGLLDFGQTRLSRLVELGYRDTVAHDCREAGCVVLEEAA